MFNKGYAEETFVVLRNDLLTNTPSKLCLNIRRSAMALLYSKEVNAFIQLGMPFPLTWLTVTGFSALVGINNKAFNKIIVELDVVYSGNNSTTHKNTFLQDLKPVIPLMLFC